MEKGQLIERIRELNPTAGQEFLTQFSDDELRQYLDQLRAAENKRVHIHGWVRKRGQQRMAS